MSRIWAAQRPEASTSCDDTGPPVVGDGAGLGALGRRRELSPCGAMADPPA
jgi:hypothetical protein